MPATTFKRNLLIGYGVSLFLLVVSALASYISIRSLLASQERVLHTGNVLMKLNDVLSILKDAETNQRGFLLTADPSFLEPFTGATDKLLGAIDEVRAVIHDNPDQVKSLDQLKEISLKRIGMLHKLAEERKGGVMPAVKDLKLGKGYMDDAMALVRQMQERERYLLTERTEKMNRFAATTPTLILVASLLAILVTVVSFARVNKDFENRLHLQQQLQEKDREITERLNIIQGIAERISAGDYKTRVTDQGRDVLGSLSVSLNKMAESLDESFTGLSEQEWLQAGVAQLNEKMIGEKNLEVLTGTIIDFMTEYTGAQLGAFYLTRDQQSLELSAGYGLDRKNLQPVVQIGEGITGQAAASGKEIELNDIKESDIVLRYSGGAIRPKTIFAVPVFHETKLKGVMEFASIHSFPVITHEFMKVAAFNIGMAIHSARDHQRLQELLHETQAQSEELQSQHAELENINAELEAQAEKLQASEEELRVQQEELQQANEELEERSRLLEEKNELILERNLEIQAKAEELAQSTRYKSEFLANMSHELRTPLNSILLLSRLLTENHSQNLTDDQVEYASVIQHSGKGLLTLIDEILDLSKIESGKMDLEWNDVRIEDVQGELMSLFAPIAKDKGIDFSIETGTDVPGTIVTDRLRMDQVLRNLLSNALKFTRKGSVRLIVTGDPSGISFTVADTGIGIPADKQRTIFEAFQQADGSTRRQYGGTGLGLSISRELARLLGGEIRLKSEVGKGSEFTLRLPLKHPGKMMSVLPPAEKPTTVEEYTKTSPANGDAAANRKFLAAVIPAPVPDDRASIHKEDKVILIIEDDTGFAKSLLDYTRSKGYKGIVSVRGDEALELARQFLPLGILLDLELPVKTGWEVMEELKQDPLTRPIPVHMMSSHEMKTRGLSQGAIDFINKPVAFEQLGEIFTRIEHALTRHPKKVLIVEENHKHAQALAYFLEGFNVSSEIRTSVDDGVEALNNRDVNCVILDMGIPALRSYDTLEEIKKRPGLENLPIIIFTGKNLSHVEEMRIKKYADSIVVKTAHSYQRILDEVSLFLHLVEENNKDNRPARYRKLEELGDVLKGKTILIADDDVRNIFSLTKSLEGFGMNVVSATDGRDAIRQLQEHEVDLVLMDMMMPEMDGYESTRRIREMPGFRNLPVIAVTAKAMTGDREKCISAGASDYITKPVDVDQLVSLLRVWLYR